RPHPGLSAKVCGVRAKGPRRLPRAERRRANAESLAHVAESAQIADGRPTSRDPGFHVDRQVFGASVLAEVLARHQSQSHQELLRRSGAQTEARMHMPLSGDRIDAAGTMVLRARARGQAAPRGKSEPPGATYRRASPVIGT